MKKILDAIKKPKFYEEHTTRFWDDEHISKEMLKAHLDDNLDAASRRGEVIAQSVAFVKDIAPPSKYPSLCDLGCGPGLYTNQFQKKGYQVTGYDISKRSIDYAKSKNNLVNYRLQSYLELDEVETYDIITLIYCDFAVLSYEKRMELLKRIYRALKKKGLFMLDVHTEHYVNKLDENKTWFFEESGFFSDKSYLCLKARYKYEGFIFVEQYTLIDQNNKSEVIRNWNKGYSPKTLKEELNSQPFEYMNHYGDFTGKAFKKESPTLMMIVQKK